jgi:thioredoxin reductase (NADPH)
VVGGGNSAVADALILSRLAKKVYLIHRRDALRATYVDAKPLEQAENVEFLWNSTVTQLHGENRLTGITVRNSAADTETQLSIDALFVSIGRSPATELAQALKLDEGGYIVCRLTTETSNPGVFAAGDVRTKALRQIVTATADGAMAAHMAQSYLSTL